MLKGELKKRRIRGGFTAADQYLLESDFQRVEATTSYLLAEYFPATLHLAIRDAVRLPAEMVQAPLPEFLTRTFRRRPRDPKFRPAVLDAYERRCAICGFNARIYDGPFGLEAAHIRWHSEGGPDRISNGLALCSLHHEAFDQGAIGLAPAGGRKLELRVSPGVSGTSETSRQLGAEGKRLQQPTDVSQLPCREFVDWHGSNVFKG